MNEHTTWYKVSSILGPPKPVTVERSTDVSIWISGRRRAISSSWERYYPTATEAWDWVIERAKNKWLYAQQELTRATQQFSDLQAERAEAGV